MKKNISRDEEAFTLIELLVVMAVIAILAAVVIVSSDIFFVRSRSSLALAQMSKSLPLMISCWGNGKQVNRPLSIATGGDDICDGEPSYGKWAYVGEGTELEDYGYASSHDEDPDPDDYLHMNSSSWWVKITSDDDNIAICCNSTIQNCQILTPFDAECDADTPEK